MAAFIGNTKSKHTEDVELLTSEIFRLERLIKLKDQAISMLRQENEQLKAELISEYEMENG